MKKLLIVTSLVLGGGLASAEDAPDVSAPELVNPSSVIVQGAGVKVGEGTVIHPTVGVETGVVSNVFFEQAGENMAGLLRVLVELSTATLSPERLGIHNEAATNPTEQRRESGMLQYLAATYLTWDQMLSTNDAVQDQGGLGAGLLFKGIVNPQKTFSLSFLEHFDRSVRALNFETSDQANRDVNQLALRLNYQPQGRNLGGYLYWRNLIDYFEDDDLQFVNRFQNTFGARVNYQWRPMTRFFLDGSIGVFTSLGDNPPPAGALGKSDAFPLRVETGIQTLLALNLTLNGRFGWTQGFYADGSSYGNVTGGLQVGYRYSPRGRVALMYDFDYQDSINANFYRDHLVKLDISQQLPPMLVNVGAEVRLRRYENTLVMGTGGERVRDDVIGAINAGATYQFRGWFAAVMTYQFAMVSTDFTYDAGGVIDDPSFLRHQLLLGVRAAY